MDVGAAGSPPTELAPLAEHIHLVSIDANPGQMDSPDKSGTRYKSVRQIEVFLGSKPGKIRFKTYSNERLSSARGFDAGFQRWFQSPGAVSVKSESDVQVTTLESIVSGPIDYLKIDTQGTELEVLLGAEKLLADTLMVELEVEFLPIYEGQPLAHEILAYMHENNFEILSINRVMKQSRFFRGIARGQTVFADLQFVKGRSIASALDHESQLRLIALLLNYGFVDFAYDIFSCNERMKAQNIELGNFFTQENRPPSRLRKRVLRTLDKFLYRFLIARKSNGLRQDSDRSWPIR